MCQTCPGIKVLEKALNVSFWMSPPPLWHEKNFSKILLDGMAWVFQILCHRKLMFLGGQP